MAKTFYYDTVGITEATITAGTLSRSCSNSSGRGRCY